MTDKDKLIFQTSKSVYKGVCVRSDFDKILVERPRIAKYAKRFKPGRKKENEVLPNKESITAPYKRKHGYGMKELNENLRPLYRFLEKNVGRSWNKVFSEICEHVNVHSAVQAHIRQHLKQDVYKQVVIEDKVVYDLIYPKWQSYRYKLNGAFYVHPTKGTLERSPSYNYKSKAIPNPNYKKLDASIWLVKEGGVWYLAKMDWIYRFGKKYGFNYKFGKEPWLKFESKNVLSSCKNEDGSPHYMVRPCVFDIISKRQLGKKELKERGLK